MTALAQINKALSLLDELNATPFGQINAKLDRIAVAVLAARRELLALLARDDHPMHSPDTSKIVSIGDFDPAYQRKLDAVREVVATPDFGGDAA